MNNPKEMSKRQARREQMRRKEARNRNIVIGLVSALAVIVAFFIIYPNFKPVGTITPAPVIPRTTVKFNTAGNPDAPVRIDEYSDFQCPYCRNFFNDTEAKLEANFIANGTLYFVYHSFGDFIGPESGKAAEAAYCAGDQEKFWQMHDINFANQTGENVGAFSDKRLLAFAENIGLDMTKFKSCFNGGNYKDMVSQDAKDGLIAKIKSTPSFILSYTVNGEKKTLLIEGAQPYDTFKQDIESALTEMGK